MERPRAGTADGPVARTGSPRSTEDAVHAALRAEIERGLAPGTPLRLSAIAERMGVSTMPVRAALKRLEGDGLVRQLARRGAVVAPLEPADIEEIQAIRWGVEGLAARLGADAMDPPTLARMATHLARIREAAARDDADVYLGATYALEDTCYGAAGRPRLLAAVQDHRRAALRYVHFLLDQEHDLEVEPAEAFYAAAAARDGIRAEQLIQAQISRLATRIADRMMQDM